MKPSFKITDGSNDRREPIKNDTVYQTIALIFEKITAGDQIESALFGPFFDFDLRLWCLNVSI